MSSKVTLKGSAEVVIKVIRVSRGTVSLEVNFDFLPKGNEETMDRLAHLVDGQKFSFIKKQVVNVGLGNTLTLKSADIKTEVTFGDC